jgi:purine-binding chemotaxis protein CheW
METTKTDETVQYLTFSLDEEVFAIDVAKVREILDYTQAMRVPGAPEFMRGIVNVRGNVIPVVDMRLKFGMSKTERTVNTCIVVMEVDVEGETTVLGALVDSVQEVFELEHGHVEPPPKMGTRWRTQFIKGIGKRNDHLIIILDIDMVFSLGELTQVERSRMSSSAATSEEAAAA